MTTTPQLPRKSAIRGRVLRALCNLPPFSSRDEVSRAVKLNPQQVSAAISHLRINGLVEAEDNHPRYGYRVRVPGPVRDACYAAGWMGTKHPLPTPPPLPLPKPAGSLSAPANSAVMALRAERDKLAAKVDALDRAIASVTAAPRPFPGP